MQESQSNARSLLTFFLASLALLACGLVSTFQDTATAPPHLTAPASATSQAPPHVTPTRPAADTLTPAASETPPAPPADTPPAETAASLRMVAALDALPGEVARLHAAPDGSLWVFTEHGFGWLQDENWRAQPLGQAQTPIGVDEAGRVWVLTDGLMYARDIATDESVDANEGWLPNPDPTGLAGRGVQTDAAGQVWLATGEDVRVFDGERWTVFAPQDMGMARPQDPDFYTPYALEMAHQSETLWVGRCDWGGPGPVGGGGARWWDGATWQGADSPVASGCVFAIQEDNQGRVWVGVDADLWRYDPAADEWQRFDPPEPPQDYRFGYIKDIALDPTGDPWPLFALCGGASCVIADARYRLHEGAWNQIGELSDAPQILVFDGAGTPWLFTGGQVYRIADNQPVEPPAAELEAAAAAVDAAGRMWAAGTGPGSETGVWVLETEASPTETLALCPPPGARQPPEFQLREGQSIVEMFTPQIRDYLNARGGAESLQTALGGPFAYKDELLPARAQVFTTDVTGDAAPEVVVDFGLFVSDENIDGALFVFTCQNGQYEAIATEPLLGYVLSDDWPDPGVRAIQDMNGNGKAEIVSSSVVIVGTHANFTRLFQIIEWDGSQFTDLIQSGDNQPSVADVFNGDGAIRDIDGDGIIELELTHGVGRGPEVSALERAQTNVWAWDGAAFTLADTRAAAPPVFRIQAVWDGDATTLRGEYDSALAFYQQAVFDEELLGWSADRIASDAAYGATPTPDPDEWPRLAAYGRYRILLLHAAQDYLPEAQTVYDTLQEKFLPGSVGGQYAELATVFWNEYNAGENIAAACAKTVDYAAAHAEEILPPLGSEFYGFGQPDYAPEDVCPFGQVVG